MALTLPSFIDILNVCLAVYRTQLSGTVNGVLVPPDTSPGSDLYAIAYATATVLDQWYGQLDSEDGALRLATAQGTDLELIGALTGTTRKPALAATVAVAANDYSAPATPVSIAAGRRLSITTARGTVKVITQADPTLAANTAGIIAAGATQGYVLAQADTTDPASMGSAGNVPSGAAVAPGDAFAGVDYWSIPVVAQPSAPLVTTHGTAGTTQRRYQLVARGRQGMTLPGPVTTLTTGNATLSGTNYDSITVPTQGDGTQGNALGWDVLYDLGTVLAPNWQLLAALTVPTTTVTNTGQATQTYAYPTVDTANAGAGGVDQEPDDGAPGYRQRIPANVAAQAGGTLAAMVASIEEIPGVLAAFVADGFAGGTASVTYTGNVVPVPASVLAAVAQKAADTKPLGTQLLGPPSQIVPVAVAVTYSITASPSVSNKSALVTPIANALAAVFTAQTPGYPVYYDAIKTAIYGVLGGGQVQTINALTLQPAGGAVYSDTVPGATGRLYGLGAVSATIT